MIFNQNSLRWPSTKSSNSASEMNLISLISNLKEVPKVVFGMGERVGLLMSVEKDKLPYEDIFF